MKTKRSSIQDTSQFSTFSSLHESELEEVSDDAVNSAYNYFDAERMKYYHGVYVRSNRNFRRKKDERPSEWYNFASVIRMCKKNGFNLRCYIKYCFINALVPKSKGKTLADIVYLRNYPQVIDYARNKTEIERLYSIYNSIIKTVMLVKRLCSSEGTVPKTAIMDIIRNGKLAEYVTNGSVSPYFLSLIRNANVLIHKYVSSSDDGTIIGDMCRRMERYGNDALKAMNMFYPSSATKTILQLCSE